MALIGLAQLLLSTNNSTPTTVSNPSTLNSTLTTASNPSTLNFQQHP